MNIAVRYFRYHFKQTLVRLIVMLAFVSLISYYGAASYFTSATGNNFYSVELIVVSAVMLILCYVVAALEFDPFKKRRNLDLWLSAPLSRTQLILIHMFNGAIHLTVTFIVAGIVTYVKLLILQNAGAVLWMSNLLWYELSLIPLLILFYGFFSAVYIIANSSRDGVIFMVLYSILPLLLEGVRRRLTDYIHESRYDEIMTFNGVINDISEHYSYELMPDDSYHRAAVTGLTSAWLIIWSIISVIAVALVIFYFSRLKTEKTGGPSDNIFGYRLLLPIEGYSVFIVVSSAAWIVSALLFIVMFLGYVIFRKGFRLKIPDIICLGVGLLVIIVAKIAL